MATKIEVFRGCQWIVQLVSTKNWGDYHWIRQDSPIPPSTEPIWSHKPGSTEVITSGYDYLFYGNDARAFDGNDAQGFFIFGKM